MKYKIVRFFLNGRRVTLKTGLTLDQAQAHCNDPETSHNTATSPQAKARTRKHGQWFDGYLKEGI